MKERKPLAVMTLMLKDRKEGNKSRAVVTGNISNSVGMCINVSMFLEAGASSVDKTYEVNSSKDLMANIEDVNTKWRKRMEKVNLVEQTSTVIEQAPNLSEHGQTERVSEQVVEESDELTRRVIEQALKRSELDEQTRKVIEQALDMSE